MPDQDGVLEEFEFDPGTYDPDFPNVDMPTSPEQERSAAFNRALIEQLIKNGDLKLLP